MKKIFVSVIILISFKHTSSQYDASYNEMQQYQYPYQNLQYQQYHQSYQNRRWKDNEDYSEYDENTCACDKCDDLKPGCLNMCPNCLLPPQPMIPSNYVFLPFPYPYPMSTKETVVPKTTERKTTTTPLTTTSTTTTTTTTEATTLITTTEAIETTITEVTTEKGLPEEYVMTMSPFHVKPKNPYMITSLRKTKPHWIPKYGIVPISDTIAEKLMLQLRSMKVLHPRKNSSRDLDDIGQFKYNL